MRAVKIKMRNIVILFFSLFLTLAVFSEISAANSKPTTVVGSQPPATSVVAGEDWLYSRANSDTTAYLGKKSSNLPAVRYQKGDNYLEFVLSDEEKTNNSSVSLETNVKEPNNPTLFYRNVFDENTDFAYKITNIPFTVKEEIMLKQFPISNLIYAFSAQTNAIPKKQKDGSINFYDKENNYLFQLDKPFMVDAKGNRSEEVGIEIVPLITQSSKLKVQNYNLKASNFNFQFPILNFQSIFNDSIFKLFEKLKINKFNDNCKLFENCKLKIENSNVQYQIILKADSKWLNDTSRVYPVIIDPTITHNADSNFSGQMNRIADSDSTTSTQLESSYGENANDPYTVLNLHFNEANGATSGIKDYVSTTRVITANGNASTTNYVTRLGMGNSLALDGTGDYLTMPDSSDFLYSDTSFTIDFWVNFNSLTGDQVFDGSYFNANNIIYFRKDNTTHKLHFMWKNSSFVKAEYTMSNDWSVTTGVWHYIAFIRNGNDFYIFIDGVSQTLTANTAISGPPDNWQRDSRNEWIGGNGNSGDYFNGYLDELRILKGRALTPEEIKASAARRPYAVYTSSVLDASASVAWNTINWTEGGVNTGDGETLYNTNSLVAQWNFNDTSGTTLTASSSGSCATSCNGTLTNFAYTASQDQATTTTGWTANNKKWGAGALMMESAASADYISITDPASNVLDPSSADLTIETWVKTTDTSAEIFSNNNANGTACANNGYYLGIDANGYPVFYLDTNGGTAGCDASTTAQFKINDGFWHKIAVSATRGTSAVIYVDGKSAGSDTSVTSYSAITVTGNVFLGGSVGGLDAVLDSTRFYSRALSASEILSNYNAGNIEIQTRTGATSDPNDGTWEAWKPTTGETQLLSMDSDQSNWDYQNQSDAYTKLLLHMDGVDASTAFVNSATTTHIATSSGNAQIDTAQSKFGGASGLFDGTGDYLSTLDSNDWFLGGQDWTIDFWIRWNDLNNSMPIAGQNEDGGPTSDNKWYIRKENNASGNKLSFKWVDTNTTRADYTMTSSWSVSTGVWYHIAFSRNGTNLYLFIDGVSQTLTVNTALGSPDNFNDIASTFYVGDDGTGGYVNGWMDELRYSKGIARWTSNFASPTGQHRPYYPRTPVQLSNETTIKQEGTGSTKLILGAPQIDGNTVALWHFEETGTTTGTFLYDETANNNDATTTGTTVVDGIFGKGRKFNGTSDVVNILPLTGGTSAQSVDFWVYPLTTTEYFIDLNGSAYVWANAGAVTATGFTSPTIYVNGLVSSNIVAGQWQHIAITTGTGINASAPKIGKTTTNYLEGMIDEIRVSNRVLSADEIAETYRMGANHHLTRQVSAVDMSAQTKLAFWIAADRPGTGLETMLGESDHANYELASSTLALSTTTVLYIKGDEIASSTSIKDSSFSGKAITTNGNARTSGMGKIGNSVYFDGTEDYLSLADNDSLDFIAADNFSVDFWFKHNTIATNPDYAITKADTSTGGYKFYMDASGDMCFDIDDDATWTPDDSACTSGIDYDDNAWHHIAGVKTGTAKIELFADSLLVAGDTSITASGSLANTNNFYAGMDRDGLSNGWDGYIDELRVLKSTALTADQIRHAYEYGLRSHQVTIDFGATLLSSDLISNSTDYNFSITATTSGLSATTSGLYLGDKIIIKENLGGTEYKAQGTVNSINTTTGAITVPSWDSGSTFPASNGYSPNATVFKWQREYFDITGAATTTRNAITNLTLRPTNGAGGRTVYLDDFRYNTNYLTASSSSSITSSNGRYMQYRAIFSSWDSFVSPFLSAISAVYTSTANMFGPIIGISGGGFLSF